MATHRDNTTMLPFFRSHFVLAIRPIYSVVRFAHGLECLDRLNIMVSFP